MNWFSRKSIESEEEKPALAEEAEYNFAILKGSEFGTTRELESDALLAEVEKIHAEVRRIKKNGVSMWNYKEVLPKIFDVIDGAFVVVREVVMKIREMEKDKIPLEKPEVVISFAEEKK